MTWVPPPPTRKLTATEYHKLPSWSSSSIRRFAANPRLEWERRRNPAEDDGKEAFAVGAIFHQLALSAGTPVQRIVQIDEGRKTKAFARARAEAPAGALICTTEEYTTAQAMYRSLQSTRTPAAALARKLLSPGEHVYFEWIHEWEHPADPPRIGLRAMLDVLRPEGVVEVKSSKNAEPWAFGNDAAAYDYPMQSALYIRAVVEACRGETGDEPLPVWYVIVENVAPHRVATIEATAAAHHQGTDRLFRTLAHLARELLRPPDEPWRSPWEELRALNRRLLLPAYYGKD